MRGRITAKTALQLFTPCSAEFIAQVCQASCCRSTTDPTGIAVTVTGEAEAQRVEAFGARVSRRTWRIEPVNKRCPFQHPETNLCVIHDDDEPFGCIASPFTINATGTMIVRNRYRLLRCFKGPGAIPVYRAHRRSLDLLLGRDQAARLAEHFDSGSTDDFPIEVEDRMVEWLLAKSKGSASAG